MDALMPAGEDGQSSEAAVGRPSAHERVSVAIPLHNEAEVFGELQRRLTAVLDELPGGPHEIVFVDDGSADATFEFIRQAAEADVASRRYSPVAQLRPSSGADCWRSRPSRVTSSSRWTAISRIDPRRSHGSSPQHDNGGYDVVYAKRVERKEAPPLRASYFLFYRLMNRLSEIEVPVDSGDFALLSQTGRRSDQPATRAQQVPPGPSYVGGFPADRDSGRARCSSRWGAQLHGRKARASGVRRNLRVLGDPTSRRLALGTLATAAASLYAEYTIFQRVFLDTSPEGFTALIVAITFFSGVQLLFLGLIGEYLGRVYDEAKGRPHFIVTEVVVGSRTPGGDAPEPASVPEGVEATTG